MSDELYDNQHLSISDLTPEDDYDFTPDEPELEFSDRDVLHFLGLVPESDDETDLTVTMEEAHADQDRSTQEV